MPRRSPLSTWFAAAVLLSACAGDLESGAGSAPPSTASHGGAIDWAPWTTESFERAATEDRLILINVVATWCHWCHVMEDTTYADPEVAAILDAHFVVIRVDSDARPDIAERYQPWGWPATAILSPGAEPALNLRGYRKPEVFAEILLELVEEHDRGALRRGDVGPEPEAVVDQDLEAIRARTVAQLDGYFDPDGLGWGGKQKYPWPGPIDYALLRARVRGEAPEEARWQARALATLAAERALIDPVWGGMYQYSLKGVWDRPHFEKIAMVQAGAIENYAHAAMVTGDHAWLDDARAVSRYLLERMQDPAGGFATSQDADLRRDGQATIEGAEFYALSDRKRRALGQPRIDRAVYADLNGLTIDALTERVRAEPDPDVLAAAVRAGERILATHRTASGGFSHGPVDDADPSILHLADQAAMGRACIGLYRVTGDPRWLEAARATAAFMRDALLDPEAGGFFAHTADPNAVGVFAQRRKPVTDNAIAADFLIDLHRYTHDDASPWLDLARGAVLAVGGDEQIRSRGKVVGRYLIALERLAASHVDVTVVGDSTDPAARALWQAALAVYEPRATVELSAPGERYPDIGAAAVYLCTDTTCSQPVRDPEQVATALDRFVADNL